MSAGGALVTQQLAEFLAAVAACPDGPSAIRVTVERAARALEAEVAAITNGHGVAAAVGFAAGRTPAAELAELAVGTGSILAVPGPGECPTVVAAFGGAEPGHLIVARSGSDGFTLDEVSLVRGMARVLELTVETMRTLESERRQAAENVRLLATLQERQLLMEQLSAIERAIARRVPLQQVLDMITNSARELLGDEAVGVCLGEPDDRTELVLRSYCGPRDEVAPRIWRVPVAQAGAAGQAILDEALVIVDGGGTSPGGFGEQCGLDVRAAMAAPVYECGTVVGSLFVGSVRPDRAYGKAEQEILLAFAEHASLAVTDAKTLAEMHEAFHDSLTGLASRALFIDRLNHAFAVADREGTEVAVLFVDLDRFKVVNDSLGHAAGDALLIAVADRLRGGLRGAETAARFGGDEFALLLHDVTRPEQAQMIAERIVESLARPFAINGNEILIGSSVGIALSTPDQRDAEALVHNADLAMYEAKRMGKGRHRLFEPGMQTYQRSTLNLAADLHRALARNEMVLRYQPIVELRTGRVTGLEALVRWMHPDRGMVAPLDFIPLAEESGAILEIGTWVLEEACRQVGIWNTQRQRQPPLSISVNLSARQLEQPEFPSIVAEALGCADLDAASLVLEITESLLVHDTATTAEQLRRLKQLGVRLAIDDFGTGYSALAYLHRFPVDILKIDKSFVDKLGSSTKAAALTRAVVQLGQTLELSTIAEGIELAEQFSELNRAGCELGQGYYFARPLEQAEVQAMLLCWRPTTS